LVLGRLPVARYGSDATECKIKTKVLSYLRQSPMRAAKLRASPTGTIAFEVDGECAVATTGSAIAPIGFLENSPNVLHDLCYDRMPTAPVLYLADHTVDNELKQRRCIAVFDLKQSEERRLVVHLGKQRKLRVFFLSESLAPLEQHVVEWDDSERAHARALLAKALKDLMDFPAERYDFHAALLEALGSGELRTQRGTPGTQTNRQVPRSPIGARADNGC